MLPIEQAAVLAVKMAGDPGTFAFLLGAGVSVAAGIPSGREILEDTCRRYYTSLNKSNPPDSLDIVEWAKTQFGETKVTYSHLLEAVFDTPAAIQGYLQHFFEGRKPTRAHECLAEMGKSGLVRVFITTNFDRLLEDALAAMDVPHTVVHSPEQLGTVRPREHSRVFILKVHGDYLSSSMRNTEMELESLDPSIAQEFRSILKSYGLVSVGYRGEDRGVRSVLESQPARFGCYWFTREEPSKSQGQMLSAVGAKMIQGRSADEFCHELLMRVQALQESPGAGTAERCREEIIAMTRKGDDAGVQWRAGTLHDDLICAVSEFAKDHERKYWASQRTAGDKTLDSWKPIYEPLMTALDSAINNYASAAVTALEYNSRAFRKFFSPLPRLFRTRIGNGYGAEIGQIPAFLIGHALLVGALLLEEWAAFSDVALLLDPKEGCPWTISLDFHHLSFFRDDARMSGLFFIDWLNRSGLLQMIGRTEEDGLNASVQANILLSVTHHVRHGIGGYWWGYAYYGTRVEPLVRRIVADKSAADMLARLTDTSGQEFRRQFYEKYLEECRTGNYRKSSSFFPVGSDVLKTLL